MLIEMEVVPIQVQQWRLQWRGGERITSSLAPSPSLPPHKITLACYQLKLGVQPNPQIPKPYLREMGVNVPRIKLGSQSLEVSKQGLGCFGMSDGYGHRKPEPEMVDLIHHAINSGATFLDTSDAYGPHTNEILIGKVRPLFCLSCEFNLSTRN